MDAMQSMPHLSTHAPSSRTHFCPLLNNQELSASFDDPLLTLQCIEIRVDPDLGVVLEEFQVPL